MSRILKFFSTQLIPLSFKARLFKTLFWGVGKITNAIFGKKFHYPRKEMQEDPMYFPSRETYYLGYKYFYRHLTLAEKDSGLENHFASQKLRLYKAQNKTGELTFSVGGDLMPYEMIQPATAANYWAEAGPFLFDADISFANLETPVDHSKAYSPVKELMINDVYFNANEEVFDLFNGGSKFKGFDVMGVANNHSLDCGVEGLEHTLEFLERKKILATGMQAKKEDHFTPLYIEKNGIRLAIISCTYSLNKEKLPEGKEWMINHLRLNMPGVDISVLKEAAKKAKANGADLLIFSLHCGNAYQAFPGSHIVDLFHRVFNECGADIILGHHGHNPQPMEQYQFTCPHSGKVKQGFAVYSLGDLAGYDFNIYCHLPLMLKFRLVKDEAGAGIAGVDAFQGIISLLNYPKKTDVRILNLTELGKTGFRHSGLTGKGRKKAGKLYQYHHKYIATMEGINWS